MEQNEELWRTQEALREAEGQRNTAQKAQREAEGERDTAKKHFRGLLTSVIVLAVLVIVSFVILGYKLISQEEIITISRRNEEKQAQLEISLQREKEERMNRAKDILAKVKSDPMVKRFYAADALFRVDFVLDFRDRDFFVEGTTGALVVGNSACPSFFCRDYGKTSSAYGFTHTEALKAALHSLNAGNFSVLGNKRFMFSTEEATAWDNKKSSLDEAAFLSINTLSPVHGISTDGIEGKLAEAFEGKAANGSSAFRFFFKTDQDGLYVMSLIRENGASSYYLVADRPLYKRDPLLQGLKEHIVSLGYGSNEVEFSLWDADERLAEKNMGFDACLDIFLEQLLKRQNPIPLL